MDELARALLDVFGELLLGLVLWHCARTQSLLLLLAHGSAEGVRDVEMEISDPHFAFARPIYFFDPALRSRGSSQDLSLGLTADVANVDINDRSKRGRGRSGFLGTGQCRRKLGGCVLSHGRSIGGRTSSSNFGTGWAVGWAVWLTNPCNLLKELVGASGFEPPASWSRTMNPRRINNLHMGTTVVCGSYTLLVSNTLSRRGASTLATANNASMWGVGTKLGTAKGNREVITPSGDDIYEEPRFLTTTAASACDFQLPTISLAHLQRP
jgi:hypothetical protein